MRMITQLTAATVTAAALLGTVGVSAAAAATPSAAAAGISLTAAAVDGDTSASQAVYHRTFVVANHSSYTLALVGYDGTNADDELPSPDAVVQPGQEISFNVTYRFLEQRELRVQFTVWNPQGDQLADYRPILIVDGGMGLTGIEVQEIPDQLGWLPPPPTNVGGGRITELFDRVTPPAADAQHL